MDFDKIKEELKKDFLLSIEMKGEKYSNTKEFFILFTIKKQSGNKNGFNIEIDFDTKGFIWDIRFKNGNYNGIMTIKNELGKIFNLISKII